MAEADWTFLTDALGSGTVDRGVTAGVPKPNGGGTFVFGMNSLATTPGVVGLFANQVGFAPMAKGASIRGCVKRGISGDVTGWAPYLFALLTGQTSSDTAYLLGLSDANPSRIMLRKGPLSGSLPDVAVSTPPTSGVLAVSSATYPVDTWLHLRLDVLVNQSGDTVINCYQNDLTANPCTAPIWEAIPGLTQFIDDTLGVNSGTPGLVGGYAGFGATFGNVTRRAYFDQLELQAQQ